MRTRRVVLGALLVTVAGALLLAFGRPFSSNAAGTPSPQPPNQSALVGSFPLLPGPPRPAFQIPEPKPLDDGDTSLWAPVARRTDARAAPGPGTRVVTELKARTPEGTANIVLVLERRERAGRVWVRVRLPLLPNGTTGWVAREALGGYVSVQTRLVIDRRRFQATLLRHGRAVFRAPVGVGKPEWPTPLGTFYIRNRLTKYESPFYGPVAFGTSARSAVLTDWPAGGFVGIHGTNRPELLPGPVSHGCIRMRNEDILRLADLMPVGTPVTIRS
jgi:lipoprotein-anchoring transpeptidase ErfK/SrfK